MTIHQFSIGETFPCHLCRGFRERSPSFIVRMLNRKSSSARDLALAALAQEILPK